MVAQQFGLLLIAGAQTHQENYARAFAADQRCRLIGLADEPDVTPRRRALNQQLAGELGVPVFDDLAAALARDDVQIVSICAEPERRARLTLRAVQAGKHVYIDKPLATTADEARAVTDAVRKAGVKSQMFSLVRTPVAQKAKQILDSGRLGMPVGLHCELLFAKGIAGTADLSQPRQEKPVAERFTFVDSKRELFCVGLYPLVLFQWLTGRRFTEISGVTGNYFFAEHQRNDVEDFASMLLGMENGLETTITVGRSGWTSHPSHGVHQIHLIGSDDSITLDAYEPRLELFTDAPAWRQPDVPHPEDPMGFWSSTQKAGGIEPKMDWIPVESAAKTDAAFFLDCLEEDRESDVSAGIGAHAVEVITAGYTAAAENRTVSLPAG